MIYLENNEVIAKFLDYLGVPLQEDLQWSFLNYLTGLILEDQPSINKIAQNTIGGMNERRLNRTLRKLRTVVNILFQELLLRFQQSPQLAIKSTGVVVLDEHIIPKTGDQIEGVDYFYAPAEKKTVLGVSLISTHYFGGKIEYPLDRKFFRREQELQKWGMPADYLPKNEIARLLIQRFSARHLPCKTWVMDCYFLTKENVKELHAHQMSYVAKIKRNWKCTYQKRHWTIRDLQASIPDAEYQQIEVFSTTTGAKRYFWVASRDVFIKSIGNQLLVYAKEEELNDANEWVEKYPGQWICVVSDMHEKSAKAIMELYTQRWAIETSYRDENQHLKLHGCMWRDIEGQYCFITLVFIAYMFLCWAKNEGDLARYNSDLTTLGAKCEAFKRYCNEHFAEWLVELKHQCSQCETARFIYELIYKGDDPINLSKLKERT